MLCKFENARRAILLLSLAAAIGTWLGYYGTTNMAQVRRPATKPGQTVDPGSLRPSSSYMPTGDVVTPRLKDPSYSIYRVPVSTDEDRKRVSRSGVIVSDHGSFVIVSSSSRTPEANFGGGSQRLEQTINLPGKRFDPIAVPPLETVQPGALGPVGKGYYIVQFGTVATDSLLADLENAGLEVLQYVPHNAFFVYGESDSIGRVAEHARVRWVGAYTSDGKRSQHLESYASGTKARVAKFDVAVFKRADLDEVTSSIVSETGATVIASMDLQSSFFDIVRISMPPSELGKIAAMGDVVRIDPYVRPVPEDERAAHIVAGNYTDTTTISPPGYNPLAQFGYDGTNVTVSVVDDGISIPGNGGFYITASNTVDGPLRGATAGAATGHGHLGASIIAGASPFGVLDPTSYNYGLGIAPKAHLINIPFLKSGNTTTDQQATDDTLNTLGVNGVKGTISNNSWGADATNAYDSFAALYDALARDGSIAGTIDPILLVFSAGNQGASGLTRPKMAKNIIATGSSENLRTELGGTRANNIDEMSDFSSRGPAADGRIKPDIVAPGDVITGSRAGSCSGMTCFDANHIWSSGTSHSAPQIAGVAALFAEYWKSTHAGANPSPAMSKAAILLTGQEMGGPLATDPLPNGNEGWGRVNMKYMLNTGVPMKHVDQATNLLSPGENVVYTGTVADPSKPFRVALVWSDPPGVADPALVNNLDLAVNINGTLYRGNVFSGGVSVSGGSADTRNNVEQVWQPAGIAAGTPVTVTVSAGALNGDGTLGSGDSTDQNFALVIYNFNEGVPTSFTVTGRVSSGAGRGVYNATVLLTNGQVSFSSRTNLFGYYYMTNIPIAAYTGSVTAKGYTFNPIPVNVVNADLTGMNFVATSGTP